MSESEYVSTAEVAAVLGYTDRTIRSWAADGTIGGCVRVGERGRWLVPRVFLSAYLGNVGNAGNVGSQVESTPLTASTAVLPVLSDSTTKGAMR